MRDAPAVDGSFATHNEVVEDFDALASEHKDAVYRQLIRACGNHEDAEDVLVEALLKAYQNLDRLREREAFRAWLAQIGRRVCWHLKAREALAPIVQLSALEAQGAQPVDAAPSPETAFAKQQMKALFDEALERLEPDHRVVYVLRDVEGHSGAEVAARLGVTLAAQKSRLHRARAQMREFLDERLQGRG